MSIGPDMLPPLPYQEQYPIKKSTWRQFKSFSGGTACLKGLIRGASFLKTETKRMFSVWATPKAVVVFKGNAPIQKG